MIYLKGSKQTKQNIVNHISNSVLQRQTNIPRPLISTNIGQSFNTETISKIPVLARVLKQGVNDGRYRASSSVQVDNDL